MFNKSMRAYLSVFVIAGLFLAGCSSDDSQQQSSPQPSQQPQAQQQGPQGQQGPQLNKKQQSIDPSSISEQELEMFAQAMQSARKVQSKARADMRKMVEDEGLTFKRFQQLMMSKRSEKLRKKMNVTDEEQAKMDSLQPKMKQAQMAAQKEIMQTIESSEISMKRFKQISRALRQNKSLMKRFKKVQADMGIMDQDTSDATTP